MGYRGKLAERQQARQLRRPQRPAAAAAGRDRPAGRGGPGPHWPAYGARVPGRGVALYAGEGSKRDGAVKFANTDPRMVAFYCTWLRRFFAIDEARLRVRLYLHEGLDLAAAVAFWSDVTGIPPSQFQKPYRAVPDPSIRHVKHVHGCVSIDYSCSTTHRSIMGLVAALLGGDVLPG
jgi:hypothetical protein